MPFPIPTTTTQAPASSSDDVAEDEDDETVELARLLIAAEMGPNWKTALKPEITAWQDDKGLKPDGKFGPGSALEMAKVVAKLPRIRYWPLGFATKTAAVEDYRTKLRAMADVLERGGHLEHAAGLRASAIAEKGEGWPASPAAVTTQTEDAATLRRAMEEVLAKRDATLKGMNNGVPV